MADDAVLDIGLDPSNVEAGFRALEQRVAASLKRLESAVSSQLGKANASINQFSRSSSKLSSEQLKTARSSRVAADAIEQSGDQAKQSSGNYAETAKAVAALAQSFDTVADRAFNALGAIASGVGAYIGAARGARQLKIENDNLIDSAIRLAGAYFSLRQTFEGIVGIIRTGSEFEQQRTQFEGLFKSVAQGDAAFQWVREFPVQAKGFSQALATLQGFGVDRLFKTLSALNNQVILLGDEQGKLQNIARQLGQGFAANALRAEELNSLVDNGVPIFQLFSRALGVSAGEIRQLASDGKLGRDAIRALIDEIERSTAGASERQLETLGGIITTLQRQFREFINLIAEAGIFDFVKEQIRSFLVEVERLRETGELKVIAQNISDALEGLGEGIVAIVQRLLQSLNELARDGSIARFGRTAGDILEQLAPSIGVVADNLDTIIKTILGFKAAGVILSGVLKVASFVAVTVAVIKYRVAILAAIKATIAYGATLISTLGSVTGLTAAINLLQAAFIRSLATLGAVTAFVGAFAVGYAIANSRVQEQIEKQKELLRQVQANTAVTKQFLEIRKDLNKAADVAIAANDAQAAAFLRNADAQVAAVFKLRNLEAISDSEAKTRAQEILQVAIDRNNRIIELREQELSATRNLEALRVQIAEQADARILAFRRSIVQEQIKNGNDRIRAAEQSLKQIERDEQQSAKRILDIRRSALDEQRSIEEEIADIRRSGLSEGAQEASRQLEIQNRLVEARQKITEAAQASTEEERKAALEAADAAQERARSLSKELSDNSQRVRILEQLKTLSKQTADTEITALEAANKEREKNKQSLQETIDLQKQQVDDLENQLGKLTRDAAQVKLDLEVGKAQKELAKIQVQLEKIKREAAIDVAIRRNGGGSVPGFNRGGRAFGAGGVDNIPAWLTRGEWVIQNPAVSYYGDQFMRMVNAMRFPRQLAQAAAGKITSLPIPPARVANNGSPRFQTGGRVNSETITLDLNINRRPIGPVTGSRDTINALVAGLSEIARAEL